MAETPVRTAISRGPCPSPLRLAGRYLEEYLEKIRRAVEQLEEDQVWWRPAAGSNSVGNLMLHLCGNLSLWIGEGVGGEPANRDRAGEFAADRTHDRAELVAGLEATVARCRRILADHADDSLDRAVSVQGYHVDVLGAVLHAVEHMSYHTGQILTLVKQVRGAGHGIEFYPQHRGE